VPISRQNPFLTCKAVARYLCVSYRLSCLLGFIDLTVYTQLYAVVIKFVYEFIHARWRYSLGLGVITVRAPLSWSIYNSMALYVRRTGNGEVALQLQHQAVPLPGYHSGVWTSCLYHQSV